MQRKTKYDITQLKFCHCFNYKRFDILQRINHVAKVTDAKTLFIKVY